MRGKLHRFIWVSDQFDRPRIKEVKRTERPGGREKLWDVSSIYLRNWRALIVPRRSWYFSIINDFNAVIDVLCWWQNSNLISLSWHLTFEFSETIDDAKVSKDIGTCWQNSLWAALEIKAARTSRMKIIINHTRGNHMWEREQSLIDGSLQ